MDHVPQGDFTGLIRPWKQDSFRLADDTPRASNRSDIESCSDNSSGSKSFDIAHGRLAKEAAVFSVELADALVADRLRKLRL
jgi:hypothetical protein